MRFLVIGAHALAAHGRPRYTGDLELFVDASPSNVKRLAAALRDFGFPQLADEAQQFTEPNRMATLGVEPVRIDITNTISGVSFDEAWRDRMRRRVGGRVVNFLGRRTYVKNKRASAAENPHRRARNLLDVALLEEMDEEE